MALPGCGPDQAGDTAPLAATFTCDAAVGPSGAPAFAVYTTVAESKLKLLDVPACAPLPTEVYTGLGIPTQAIAAVGGSAGGEGHYLYALPDGAAIDYFYARRAEQTAALPRYERIVRYEAGRFALLRPVSAYDMLGWYMGASADSAYALAIQAVGSGLEARFYARAGAPPEATALPQELSSFQEERLPAPTFHFYEQSLALGPYAGRVNWRQDSCVIALVRAGATIELKALK